MGMPAAYGGGITPFYVFNEYIDHFTHFKLARLG